MASTVQHVSHMNVYVRNIVFPNIASVLARVRTCKLELRRQTIYQPRCWGRPVLNNFGRKYEGRDCTSSAQLQHARAVFNEDDALLNAFTAR